MKTFKRNAVVITVLLFVCVAAYLNWSYNKNADSEVIAEVSPSETVSPSGDKDPADTPSDAGLFYDANASVNTEYFDAARLNRQQARDSAAATLATVSNTDGATQDMIDTALEQISNIAADTMKEAELEDLIKAKGFADCVIYISAEGVHVTVPAPQDGLPASAVAQITDIVTSQTAYKAVDMQIIEVK